MLFLKSLLKWVIPNVTVVQIQSEEIAGVEDLADFHKETIEQIAANLQHPVVKVADSNPGAAAGATIPTSTSAFGSNYQLRLIHSTNIIRYYETFGRAAIAAKYSMGLRL